MQGVFFILATGGDKGKELNLLDEGQRGIKRKHDFLRGKKIEEKKRKGAKSFNYPTLTLLHPNPDGDGPFRQRRMRSVTGRK